MRIFSAIFIAIGIVLLLDGASVLLRRSSGSGRRAGGE